MSAFLAAHFPPLMFSGLLIFLLSGFPVAFSLAATGLLFGFLGIHFGIFPETLFHALPLRVFGIMQNETLLAIPFFTLMGLILERSGMAEDLLETAGQVFGPVRGGLAIAVIFVGALLAATTGVVAAAVISMGLISLPVMLRYGYHRPLATGVIAASGTLAQIVPPSLVLIVIADQLGRSVGDLYKGAILPSVGLILLYLFFIAAVALIRPNWLPALPPEARDFREPNGRSGYRSLGVMMLLAVLCGLVFGHFYDDLLSWWREKPVTAPAPTDERIVMGTTFAAFVAIAAAMLDRALFNQQLLSRLTHRVITVMIPPLVLIFLVLGTIFIGVATPTEGGAMGAVGAMVVAMLRRRFSLTMLRESLLGATRLSIFVLAILLGSTVFSFVFIAANGPEWVKELFARLPGEALGFLVVVNTLVFILGMFLDFFEIAFIVLPLLAPVAEHLGLDLVWFGVLIGINLQTSFLTPPFGFALFYLRSVAPNKHYRDAVTGQTIAPVTTWEIYKGVVPFILLQLVMVCAAIVWPQLITANLDVAKKVDLETIEIPFQGSDGPSGWGENQ
jgi:TRAP-type mannitol/chloroaromatic compound transport system permease large subunit